MKWPLSVLLLCVVAIGVSSDPEKGTTKHEANPPCQGPSSVTLNNNEKPTTKADAANHDTPKWYAALQRSDWWLVIIAALTGCAIAYQAAEMRRASDVMRGQLTHMQESLERQLRAYVVAEVGSIVNIADPLPEPGLEPTEARRKFPKWGPVVREQIKNTGQTPAYEVCHWGGIELREYPPRSILPGPPDDFMTSKVTSLLGPGIIATKTLFSAPL